MPPRSKVKGGPKKKSKGGDASVAKMVTYEDTFEQGGEDSFHHDRDKVLLEDTTNTSARRFRPVDGDDEFNSEEDVFTGKGFAHSDDEPSGDEEFYDDEGGYDEVEPVAPKARKSKKQGETAPKGRYAKPERTSSDEEAEEDEEDDSSEGSGSEAGVRGEEELEDDETWGANPSAYYARPSTRRAREASDSGDEDLEERRAMEEREAKVLQRKVREGMGRDDFGFDDRFGGGDEDEAKVDPTPSAPAVPLPTEPAALLRHLELTNPLTLALAREWADLSDRLPRVAEAFKNRMKDDPDHPALGMSALHYQTLITYATTLAFYIHLASLPASSRPDLATHPVMNRLLQLKEALSELEDQDFAGDDDDDDEESGSDSGAWGPDGEFGSEGSLDSDELNELKSMGERSQADEIAWRRDMLAGMEEDELAELMGDLQNLKKKDRKASKKSLSLSEDKSEKKPKKKVKPTKELAFPALDEPTPSFSTSSSKKSKSKSSMPNRTAEDDAHLEPTTLASADSSAKDAARHSLRFHTSKIESASNRRASARQGRMGGDDDVPYRDKKAGREAALRKSTGAGLGAEDGMDLDGEEWGEGDKKRAREVREEYDPGEADEGTDGYYELVKKRKREDKEEKQAAYDEAREAERFVEDDSTTGPRTLTRAILKNKGLTPHRNKSVRNPRVKKKLRYEKAKKQVSSRQAVYKGGQGALKGDYGGESTGISTVIKSRKF